MKTEIEGAPAVALRQTATAAAKLPVQRADRKEARAWPYAYFEIAQRAAGFDGFLSAAGAHPLRHDEALVMRRRVAMMRAVP